MPAEDRKGQARTAGMEAHLRAQLLSSAGALLEVVGDGLELILKGLMGRMQGDTRRIEENIVLLMIH